MDVLKLLDSQNRCLEKFLAQSQELLSYLENGDTSKLDFFDLQRNAALKAFGLYDRKITEVALTLRPEERTPLLLSSVQETLNKKAQIIQTILAVDQQIIAHIEKAKLHLLEEQTLSERSNSYVRKFKSSWTPELGEKLDGKI